MPGEYDSDHDRIYCEKCDWAEFGCGGGIAAAWHMHDHDMEVHSGDHAAEEG